MVKWFEEKDKVWYTNNELYLNTSCVLIDAAGGTVQCSLFIPLLTRPLLSATITLTVSLLQVKSNKVKVNFHLVCHYLLPYQVRISLPAEMSPIPFKLK